MRRRLKANKVIRISHGIYANPEIWKSLDLKAQTLELTKALAMQHPEWVFAGLNAAAIHGLQYRTGLHRDRHVYIATQHESPTNAQRHVQHIHTPSEECTEINGLHITTMARTLVDCALRYDFRDVLVMFDFARLHHLATQRSIMTVCKSLSHITRANKQKLTALMQYTSPLSESVGESLCRGTMLEAGFAAPRQQVVHNNPTKPGHTFRTDFEYVSADGRTVIVEFDGVQKYIDRSMTNNHTLRTVVHAEQDRERTLLREPRVKAILRFDYDQVMQRTPIIQALLNAGVPQTLSPPIES